MDTKKIRALLTALEKGSLTAAAEEMGYTQSGLTHMMNSLEDELGIRLLVRSKGGVRLSPAGRELLPQLTALSDCAAELERSVEKLVQRSFTVLRLGAYSSVSRQWLPAILAELRRVSPEIDVSITTGGMREIYEAVKNDELDCAIISYQSALCQNMHWVGLRDDPLLAILPADFQRNIIDQLCIAGRQKDTGRFLLVEPPAAAGQREVQHVVGEVGIEPELVGRVLPGEPALQELEGVGQLPVPARR